MQLRMMPDLDVSSKFQLIHSEKEFRFLLNIFLSFSFENDLFRTPQKICPERAKP